MTPTSQRPELQAGPSMILKRLLSVAVLLLGLPVLGSSPDEEFSLREHLRIDHESGGDAYFFIVQDRQRGGFASVGVVELATGERSFLSATMDLKEGMAVHRFEDHSTGWHAEFVIDMGMRHIAEPGTVGGGSTSDWLQHVVELTADPSSEGTIRISTSDGAEVSWLESGGISAGERQERKGIAIQELGRRLAETPPPPSSQRAVTLIVTLLSENSGSMADHFEDLVLALEGAFHAADLPALGQADEGQPPKSVHVPRSESEGDVERMRRSLKIYLRSALD